MDNKEKRNEFFNQIKVNKNVSKSVIAKNNFFEMIDGNEEALNMLSVKRLKKLEKYYDGIIKQNNEKIKRLNNNC